MAKLQLQTTALAESLDKLTQLASTFITAETNRRIQLGREKEDRVAGAYRYLLGEENKKIGDLELALDTVEQNFLDRGIEIKSVSDQHRSPDAEAILAAAYEGAGELLNVQLDDAEDYRERLEVQLRDTNKMRRHIDLFDDAISNVDPAFSGEKHLVEAADVAEAARLFIEKRAEVIPQYSKEIEQRLEYFQTPEGMTGLEAGYFERLQEEIDREGLIATADHSTHISAIQSYELPRQQIVETLKMRTQDPAMVLGRHFAPMGALKEKIDEETVPNTQKALKVELEKLYSDLGSVLYPQMMDAEGNWATPTDALAGKMARDLAGSLALLNEGDPTEFVAYLDHVQSYYNEMKEDQTEQGRAISNRIRSEILTVLGIDMEVPVQFGDEVLSQIEIILLHYKELERIEMEQSFHGIQVSKNIQPNVSFDTSYPSPDNQDLENFMKSKRKE